jgi:predicted nuclease of restriction endonuclease-like RecB superfamily
MAFKSNFERTVQKLLPKWTKYEVDTIHFIQPEKKRTYKPDWKIRENVYLEAKGKWTREDRQKHLWLREQHPELTIYMLFMKAFNPIYKGSKTTYADFCEEHGIEWADIKMGIPKHWVKK